MGDPVDRQAVLDVLDEWIVECQEREPTCAEFGPTVKLLRAIQGELRDLPRWGALAPDGGPG